MRDGLALPAVDLHLHAWDVGRAMVEVAGPRSNVLTVGSTRCPTR